jgi:exodeoxyribonuclease V
MTQNPPAQPVSTAAQFASYEPSDDQVKAEEGVLEWFLSTKARNPMVTIGGYAGTGKTALTGRLSKVLCEKRPELRVAFATYTGRASQVLAASLKRAGVSPAHSISTIHKLMYRPKVNLQTGRITGWQRADGIDADLIVIDEASMVPQSVLDDLLSYGIPIICVGDHGQLPPVGEDAGIMKNPDFRLETIHRQAKGNPVIELSSLVRMGLPGDVIVDFINNANDERVAHARGPGGIEEAMDFAAPPGMIITFTNWQRVAINNKMRHAMGYRGAPQKGESIICVKNAYLDFGLLANGMRGNVVECKPHKDHTFEVTMDVGEPDPYTFIASKHQFGRPKTFAGFDEVPGEHWDWESVGVLLDYGYALTCHKAQGSQAANVAVCMERSLAKLDRDERTRWLYTALTRSSDKVLLITGV